MMFFLEFLAFLRQKMFEKQLIRSFNFNAFENILSQSSVNEFYAATKLALKKVRFWFFVLFFNFLYVETKIFPETPLKVLQLLQLSNFSRAQIWWIYMGLGGMTGAIRDQPKVAPVTTHFHWQDPSLSTESRRDEKPPACFSVLGVSGSSLGRTSYSNTCL